MCRSNLRGPAGGLSRKASRIVSTSEELLAYLDETCDGSHPHEQLAGSHEGVARCHAARVYTKELCEKMALGIAATLRGVKAAFPRIVADAPLASP
eukprot:2589179-Heterocapsa_arctica.AAC.1